MNSGPPPSLWFLLWATMGAGTALVLISLGILLAQYIPPSLVPPQSGTHSQVYSTPSPGTSRPALHPAAAPNLIAERPPVILQVIDDSPCRLGNSLLSPQTE